MGYDNDVKVKLENEKDKSQNLVFSLPLDYFWNRLNEEDLFEIAKQFMCEGYFTKVLKDFIEEPAEQRGFLTTYTDANILKFKEELIKLAEPLKEKYIEDLRDNEQRRWWQIGRSIKKVIEILFPERNIQYNINPYTDDFYIIDKDNANDNVLTINIFDFNCYIKNESKGVDADDYFYKIKEKLNYIIQDKDRYSKLFNQFREENEQLKRKIKELESK